MPTVKLEPWKEVVVHDVTQLDPADFFETILRTALGHDGPTTLPDVLWGACDGHGFAWLRTLIDESEEAEREAMKGRLHVRMLWFCRLDEYTLERPVRYKGQEGFVRLVEARSFESAAIPAFLATIAE